MNEQPMWQEYPHLFANGKFKVRYSDKDYSFLGMDREGWNCRIIAPRDVEPFAHLKEETYKALTACTLLARPISDMTEKELVSLFETDELKNGLDTNHVKGQLINKANSRTLILEWALNIADMGIYPGPQSDFEFERLEAVYLN